MKTKITFFTAILLLTINFMLLTLNSNAQAPNYLWAKRAGGADDDEAKSIAVDANGNTYVAGTFTSYSIDFDTTTLTKVNSGSTNSSFSDIFIVKYDASGNVVWAKSAGGTYDDGAQSIASDANGNTYVVGYFSSPSIIFGTNTLYNSTTDADIFIVKYDTSGNVLWAKSDGDYDGDYARSVTVDPNGNTYVVGSFNDVISFDTIMLFANPNCTEMFIVKYDTSGNLLWAKSAVGTYVGTSYDYASSNTVDANGNTCVTGYFNSDSIKFGVTTLTNAKNLNFSNDMFVVKYNTTGNVLWAKSAGGTGDDYARSVTFDANGNTYVVGYFNSASIIFGTTTLYNMQSGADMFIVKYDALGNVLWAKSTSGTNNDVIATSVTVDAYGNTYTVGYYNSQYISFGTTPQLTRVGQSDIFIVKYDASGNALWAKSAGGTDYDYASSVTVDSNGNTYIAGYFEQHSITFGSTTITNTFSGSAGVMFSDMFIVKNDASPTCNSNYTAVYDTLQNNFTLIIDATTSAFANSYYWDFGDGSTSTLPTPTHTFTVDTVYNVCLKTKTASNDSCSYCNIIGKDYLGNIYRTSGFTINVKNSTPIITANGTTLTSSCATGNQWYFNGNIITGATAQNYTATQNGNYTVIANGSAASAPYSVTSIPPPTPTISASGRTLTSSAATGNQWYFNGNIIPGATSQSYTATQNGNYTVIANGSAASAPYSVTSIPPPTPTISASGTTLTSSAATGNQWYFNGNIISGATSQSYTATQNGSYTVKINGSATSAPYSVTTLTGIAENSFASTINIYPNPTSGIINILLEQSAKAQIKITDVLGNSAYQSNSTASTFQIDLSSQSNGVYFLQLKTEQGTTNKKLIIQK